LGIERALAGEFSARNTSRRRARTGSDSDPDPAFASADDDEHWLAGALALLERTPARTTTRAITGPGLPSALILLGPR
jgi:hypothetical protein